MCIDLSCSRNGSQRFLSSSCLVFQGCHLILFLCLRSCSFICLVLMLCLVVFVLVVHSLDFFFSPENTSDIFVKK